MSEVVDGRGEGEITRRNEIDISRAPNTQYPIPTPLRYMERFRRRSSSCGWQRVRRSLSSASGNNSDDDEEPTNDDDDNDSGTGSDSKKTAGSATGSTADLCDVQEEGDEDDRLFERARRRSSVVLIQALVEEAMEGEDDEEDEDEDEEDEGRCASPGASGSESDGDELSPSEDAQLLAMARGRQPSRRRSSVAFTETHHHHPNRKAHDDTADDSFPRLARRRSSAPASMLQALMNAVMDIGPDSDSD